MNDLTNPFEYEAANNLSTDAIIDYYIEDYNYSRFIRSKRNVFLVGERGCGKTMALVYNSLPVQTLKAAKGRQPVPLEYIGVYIPCNTPLTHKTEYQLLNNFQAATISEHFLTLAILFEIANTLGKLPNLLSQDDEASLRKDVSFVLDMTLPEATSFLDAFKQAVQREATFTQREINDPGSDSFYRSARNFSTAVIPFVEMLRRTARLRDSHFMLMIDDAHDLNDFQIRCLNSWIAYRDHSVFSFKAATAKVDQPHRITTTGGSIFEGHDYLLIDMEQPYQNDESNFGRLAERIVQRRLQEVGIDKSPADFFPSDDRFEQEIEQCREVVRERAKEKYPEGTPKAINDYVYKFARAEWFRTRPAHANLPAYSGFQTLVFLSTGVIRNLLEPCYWMYDDARSRASAEGGSGGVQSIGSQVQRDRILDRSRRLWERMRNELDKTVEGCSRKQAEQIYNLFDKLAVLFRERLEKHQSEPRAISFSISGATEEVMDQLRPLLDIARKAQLLYARTGPAKEKGRLQTYYVPNRMLWPVRGLDPYGQHARVSLKASDLWSAAQGTDLPFSAAVDDGGDEQASGTADDRQRGLFDE
jgi:hypothetical protein